MGFHQKVSEYDLEMKQPHIADQPAAPEEDTQTEQNDPFMIEWYFFGKINTYIHVLHKIKNIAHFIILT